jgi:DNA polymerase-3 subunit delta
MDSGEPAEVAMKSLAPPVFFKQEPLFRAQLTRWSLPALETVMQRLFALEAQCKQTGIPAETLCSQALLAISSR